MGKHNAVRDARHSAGYTHKPFNRIIPVPRHMSRKSRHEALKRHGQWRETDLVMPKPWLWLIRVGLLAAITGVILGITGLPSSHAKAVVLSPAQASYQSGYIRGQQYAPTIIVNSRGNGAKYWWCFYAKVQGTWIANNGISNLTGIQNPHNVFPAVPTGEAGVLADQWMDGCEKAITQHGSQIQESVRS